MNNRYSDQGVRDGAHDLCAHLNVPATALSDAHDNTSLLTYNIGLSSKLDNVDCITFVSSFDIATLTETHVCSDLHLDLFKEFCVFTARATKLSHQDRAFGGVIVLVRKSISNYVKKILVDVKNVIVVKIDKDLFGTVKYTVLVAAYIPPNNSIFWKISQNGYGLEIIEKCIMDLYDELDGFFLMLCGDFNARTGSKSCSIFSDFEDVMAEEADLFPRVSQDVDFNTFGEQLLEMGYMYECIIPNGLLERGF